MKRLRELAANTPVMRKVQAMLDSVDPLPESEERMLRMRRELDRKRSPSAARLPALGLAALVVLFGASAFAAVRIYAAVVAAPASAKDSLAARPPVHDAARRAHHKPLTNIAPNVPAQAPAPAQDAVSANDPPSSVASAEAQPVAEPLSPVSPQAKTTRSPSARSELRGRSHPEPKAGSASATASDSELVHRALKALRSDRDPALAARLLEEHRARNPAGPLAEEALSLQIEAAGLLEDPRARAFAREYLARYPNGRYLSVAQGALQETAP